MSRTVPNPKSKAFINQRFSSKLNEVLESLSETSFGPKQMVDFANNIWIVNDIVVPFTNQGPSISHLKNIE
jgi:hypothetical protein